jgi:hypothetical protein
MPQGNGTGPNGSGPMTGRGAGYCSGNASPGSINRGPARRCKNLSRKLFGRGRASLERGQGQGMKKR